MIPSNDYAKLAFYRTERLENDLRLLRKFSLTGGADDAFGSPVCGNRIVLSGRGIVCCEVAAEGSETFLR